MTLMISFAVGAQVHVVQKGGNWYLAPLVSDRYVVLLNGRQWNSLSFQCLSSVISVLVWHRGLFLLLCICFCVVLQVWDLLRMTEHMKNNGTVLLGEASQSADLVEEKVASPSDFSSVFRLGSQMRATLNGREHASRSHLYFFYSFYSI